MALASADSGLQLDLGDRAKRCLSEDPGPYGLFSRAEEKKLSDDVIEKAFISSATVCRTYFTPSAMLSAFLRIARGPL